MLQKSLYLFFVLLLWLCCLPSDPAAEIKPEQKAREIESQIFTLIATGAANLQTLSSDFSQEKHLSMLKDPLISIGKFAYEKPDRLYWEIVKPSPAGFAVQGGQARRWGSDPRVTETLEIDQEPMIKAIVEQVFAWVRADFPWLEKRYRITVREETPFKLKLIPLSPREKKVLAYIAITYSQDWTNVRSVEIHEKGGDFTRLVFFNTHLNPPLPKDFFGK